MAVGKNVKLLAEAGIVIGDPEQLPDALKAKIEALTDGEVQALISVKKKVGGTIAGKEDLWMDD